MTNLDRILKSRDNKSPSSQSYGFSNSHVWVWELDHKGGSALKNRCFCTVVLEKTLESRLDCKEIQPVHPQGNQSKYSLERLMLKLKRQYFGHLRRRTDSLEKNLILRKIEGHDGGWDGWMASLTQWTWVSVNSGSWWWTGRPGVLQSMGSQRVRYNWVNWTELNSKNSFWPYRLFYSALLKFFRLDF